MVGRRAHGELEAQVMRVLWEQSEPIGAGQVQDQIPEPAPAYTTLLTVLDRLEKKGQVARFEESPRKVRFRAARSGDERASSAMVDALAVAQDRQAALLRFAGSLTDDDADVLRQAMARKSR